MDMQMTTNVPDWLTPIAWLFITLALLSAAAITYDIYARRHRHDTVAAELVWITSALYLGPFALALYARHGRATVGAGLPGGGASAVAHLIGVPLVIASGLTIAGINLWVMIIVIGLLAMVFLFGYERLATPRGSGAPMPVLAAAATAALTVLAFDIGMGGWMLLLHFNEFMPPADEGSFWFLMQIGIVLGLISGYPVVRWLTRRGRSVTPA